MASFSRASRLQNGRVLCAKSLNISELRGDVSLTITEALQGIQELVQFCLSENGPRRSCQVQDIIRKIHSNLTNAQEACEEYVHEYDKQICSMVNEIGRLEAKVQEQKVNRDIKRTQLKNKQDEVRQLRESHERYQRSIDDITNEISTQQGHVNGLITATFVTLAIPIIGWVSSIITASLADDHQSKVNELNAALKQVENDLKVVTSQEKDAQDELKCMDDQINYIEDELRKMDGILNEMRQNRKEFLQFGESMKKIHNMVSSLHGKGEVLHRSNRDYVSMNVLLPSVKDIVESLATGGNTEYFRAILDTRSYDEYYGFFNSSAQSITAKIKQLAIGDDQF